MSTDLQEKTKEFCTADLGSGTIDARTTVPGTGLLRVDSFSKKLEELFRNTVDEAAAREAAQSSVDGSQIETATEELFQNSTRMSSTTDMGTSYSVEEPPITDDSNRSEFSDLTLEEKSFRDPGKHTTQKNTRERNIDHQAVEALIESHIKYNPETKQKRPYFRRSKYPKEVVERFEARKKVQKRERNRVLAAESRRRQKQRLETLEEENVHLRHQLSMLVERLQHYETFE